MTRRTGFLVFLLLLLGLAILLGQHRLGAVSNNAAVQRNTDAVPHIGRIVVLNGCGISGAAVAVSGFLRDANFDVKETGDADSWNYPFTLVVSKTRDMTIAKQVAQALSTDKIVMMRDGDDTYDAAVIIGPDFGEKLE